MSAGGTGLSGESTQKFGRAVEIQLDYSQETVIHLRLTAKNDIDEPRPLTNYSNPVPPPII